MCRLGLGLGIWILGPQVRLSSLSVLFRWQGLGLFGGGLGLQLLLGPGLGSFPKLGDPNIDPNIL